MNHPPTQTHPTDTHPPHLLLHLRQCSNLSICHVKYFSLGRDTNRLLQLVCSLFPQSIPQSKLIPSQYITRYVLTQRKSPHLFHCLQNNTRYHPVYKHDKAVYIDVDSRVVRVVVAGFCASSAAQHPRHPRTTSTACVPTPGDMKTPNLLQNKKKNFMASAPPPATAAYSAYVVDTTKKAAEATG